MKYSNGLNNFDKVYYINLDHRIDRYKHINSELSKTNIDVNKIQKINGIYIQNFGIMGCAKSHILALETFLKSPVENQTCIIFEDDFEFTVNQDTVNKLINNVFNNLNKFDVLMFASNTLKEQLTIFTFLTKILDAQTLSGYAVSRKFATLLLNNYKESTELLEKIGYKYHPYCFDIYMKKLQPLSDWYCLNPKIGKQIISYSDIENKIVDYKC